VLRAALIVTLALATPASADLWTAAPPESPPPTARWSPPLPNAASPVPDDGGRNGRANRRFTLTVAVDPACGETPAVVQDALTFARTHTDVAVHVLLATRPTRSPEVMRILVTAAEAGATVTWAPGVVSRLAPAALPAVYLEDRRGGGARATGRPSLEMLWRTVVQESGS
jgi:hypothetical protein